MIIDSSAILAIAYAEPEAMDFAEALRGATIRRMSAASFVECSIVLTGRLGPTGPQKLDRIIEASAVTIEPVTAEQAMIARQAFLAFGKGRSPAKLNFGDCFSYALARAFNEPLLFKGADFAQTDIRPAR